MTENLNGLLHPQAGEPAPVGVLVSILGDPTQHFRLDMDQAPQAIATFRQVATELRDLRFEVSQLADVPAPGLDAVSINAAKEIGQWAVSEEPAQLAANQMDLPAQPEKIGATRRTLARSRSTWTPPTTSCATSMPSDLPGLELTQVDGHPTIRTKNSAAGTSCFFNVAVAERQTFVVVFTSLGDGLEEPGGPAKALAEDVLAYLPPLKG